MGVPLLYFPRKVDISRKHPSISPKNEKGQLFLFPKQHPPPLFFFLLLGQGCDGALLTMRS